MYLLLQPPALGRDWKTLADKMGYSNERIKFYECRREPVQELITDYENQGKPISELLTFLEEMERFDLIGDLQKFIEKTPTPEEIEAQQMLEWERHQSQAAEKAKTRFERYDVFIAYAKPDRLFADEIVRRLEGPPYHLKVCIDYRDFLPGNNHLETAAMAIEERCRKILLILSENFNRCKDADFQANVALSLSSDAKHNDLIPILYKPCKVPSTLKFITHLDYISERSRQYFWDNLAKSIGYNDGNTCNGKT